MYPTWEPSNQGEKSRIVAKYGKVALSTTSQAPPPAIFPPPLDLDAIHVGSITLNIVPTKHGPPFRKRKLQMKAPHHSLGSRLCNLSIDIPPFSPPCKAQNLGMKASP